MTTPGDAAPDPDGGAPTGPEEPEGLPHDAISEVAAEADAFRPATRHHLEDVVGDGPPPNPRVGRQRFLVAYLQVALVLALLVGVLELLAPDDRREAAGLLMVGVFIVAPLGRVLWLVVRWFRIGDRRYAAIGLVLLAVVATGLALR